MIKFGESTRSNPNPPLEDLILSEAELYILTGYKMPRFQLEELKRMGFFRARQNTRTGHIILERIHFKP